MDSVYLKQVQYKPKKKAELANAVAPDVFTLGGLIKNTSHSLIFDGYKSTDKEQNWYMKCMGMRKERIRIFFPRGNFKEIYSLSVEEACSTDSTYFSCIKREFLDMKLLYHNTDSAGVKNFIAVTEMDAIRMIDLEYGSHELAYEKVREYANNPKYTITPVLSSKYENWIIQAFDLFSMHGLRPFMFVGLCQQIYEQSQEIQEYGEFWEVYGNIWRYINLHSIYREKAKRGYPTLGEELTFKLMN